MHRTIFELANLLDCGVSEITKKSSGETHLSNVCSRLLAMTNNNSSDAYILGSDYIGNVIVYKTNDTPRVARAIGEPLMRPWAHRNPPQAYRTQHEAFLAQLRAIKMHGNAPEPSPEPTPEPTPSGCTLHGVRNCTICNPPFPSPSPPSPADDLREKFSEYKRTVRALRKFSVERNLPDLRSMRNMKDGIMLIAAGLPVAGIVSNVVSHFSEETRRQAGLPGDPFDWGAWGADQAGDFDHGASPAIEKAIIANVPTWIWGGAGIGKSVGAKKGADKIGQMYYECNLSGMMASAVTGKDVLDPAKNFFVASTFCLAYEHGGVWNGEEIDAAHPNVLTAINNAIASDSFWNPATQTEIKRHKDFRIVVTANTNGQGAANGFIRNKIDRASLDRFACAMFFLSLDTRLEDNIIGALEADLLSAL